MSRVQVFALELLMAFESSEESIDHHVKLYNSVRASLVALGGSVMELYPEFARQTVTTEKEIVDELDGDSSGRWEFPNAPDPTELEEVMAALQAGALDLAPTVSMGDDEGWV